MGKYYAFVEHTMAQLGKMTDRELNTTVLGHRLCKDVFNVGCEPNLASDSGLVVREGDAWVDVDFCHEWAHCGPLLDYLASRGVASFNDPITFAFISKGSHVIAGAIHENIKRAAAMVYIMVKQQEQAL